MRKETVCKNRIYERKLRKSEERYRIVADFTYDWEFWISPEGRMLYVSPSCERITGYKPADFINDAGLFEKIIHPDDKERVITHIKKNSKQKKIINLDFRIIRSDGNISWIGHISQPVYGNDKTPMGRRASNREITGRKKIEEELIKSEIRYRTVADFTYDWEFWISPEGRMLYVSPSCERITGYKPADFINDAGLFEEIIHPDDKTRVINEIKKLSEQKKVISIEFRIIRHDGNIRWIGHISQPVYGTDRSALGRRASNRDITHSKKMEERLKESQAMLHEQNIVLEQKNMALKELIDQIEFEKNRIKKNISVNIEKLVVPVISRIKSLASDDMQKKYSEILEKTILEIYSSFGSKITDINIKLTMKEVEICNLIKNGFSSKEISEILKTSVRTVETHRKNIRKKLNLTNAEVNLTSYLHNYERGALKDN